MTHARINDYGAWLRRERDFKNQVYAHVLAARPGLVPAAAFKLVWGSVEVPEGELTSEEWDEAVLSTAARLLEGGS